MTSTKPVDYRSDQQREDEAGTKRDNRAWRWRFAAVSALILVAVWAATMLARAPNVMNRF